MGRERREPGGTQETPVTERADRASLAGGLSRPDSGGPKPGGAPPLLQLQRSPLRALTGHTHLCLNCQAGLLAQPTAPCPVLWVPSTQVPSAPQARPQTTLSVEPTWVHGAPAYPLSLEMQRVHSSPKSATAPSLRAVTQLVSCHSNVSGANQTLAH